MNKPQKYQVKSEPVRKRHQPKGLKIIHDDRDIIVVEKAPGLLTVSNEQVKEHTAYYLLTNYVRKGNSKSRARLFIVHRLDRDTSGVLVFAKTPQAKNFLQDEWEGFQKTYRAVVHGTMPEKEGLITSYLAESDTHRMYSVSDPEKGKLARTQYRVLRESNSRSLLEIDLLTGRKNQIRVHLADKGHPVIGDKKYGKMGKGAKRLALHASSITINHPFSQEMMTFTTELPRELKALMKAW